MIFITTTNIKIILLKASQSFQLILDQSKPIGINVVYYGIFGFFSVLEYESSNKLMQNLKLENKQNCPNSIFCCLSG